MPKLIALVATAVMLDGVRTVIQPGDALPELSPHDAAALVAGGAAEDTAATAADNKAQAKEAAKAAADFKAARQRVQAEQASTAPADPPAAD